MDEDDLDFTPASNTSNLASLFGFSKKPLKGNSSLTYTAPKPPKKEASPSKKQSAEENSNKAKILCSKAVFAHKLQQDNTYANQGLAGVVITGDHDSRFYMIVLYKPSKEHLCKTRITENFNFVSPNNYASFYDDNMQNWSVMFHSLSDVEEFAEMVSICKFYSASNTSESIIVQDLTTIAPAKIDLNSTIKVTLSSKSLKLGEIRLLKNQSKEKIKLSDSRFTPFQKALINCSEGCKKILVVSNKLCGQWSSELSPNEDLILVVNVEQIFLDHEELSLSSKIIDDGVESSLDSSTEERKIKARGDSIKEALTNTKFQKANLISRMARMGQATFPLKSLTSDASDSEEEISRMSSPKPKMPKNKGNALHQSSSVSHVIPSQNSEAKQISLYQNDMTWQQSQLGKSSVVYQQLMPVSSSPICSPTTDSSFSVYISESRVQAAELRMGISKISEKMDLVLSKVQTLNVTESETKSFQHSLIDHNGILSSVQCLITENGNLKKKVEEQREKIEQQNDRIFQLLELNHKYLEQNSTSHDKQSEHETKLKTQIDSLQRKEAEMETEYQKSVDRIKKLEEELNSSEKAKLEQNENVERLRHEVESFKKKVEISETEKKRGIENMEEKFSKVLEANMKYKEKLKEIISENEKLKAMVRSQVQEIKSAKLELKNWEGEKQEYERTVKSLANKVLVDESETENKIDGYLNSIQKLEKDKENILNTIQDEKTKLEEDFKNKIHNLYLLLKNNFSNEKYTSSILVTIKRCLKEILGAYFQEEELDLSDEHINITSKFPKQLIPVPATRTTIQNSELVDKETKISPNAEAGMSTTITHTEKKEIVKGDDIENEEKMKTEIIGGKEIEKGENDSRFKSYDQGWRPSKPPPPPLFDDEEEEDDWRN